jgi:epoxyqueuosine reductase
MDLTSHIEETSKSLGFAWMQVTQVQPLSDAFQRFSAWLEAGYHGTMSYMETRKAAYQHPHSVLEGSKTIVVLGMPYTPATSLRNAYVENRANPQKRKAIQRALINNSLNKNENEGMIAAYAAGTTDYHDVIHERLKKLKKTIQEHYPLATVRGVVDTAPLLEREVARAAGLGWIGKNTLLLRRDYGSYFFLAALLLDIELSAEDQSSNQKQLPATPSVIYRSETDHCGSCTACLDACPTDAFVQPYVLDASKCISYLTIEHRGEISSELRSNMGAWILGCDICQQVCPWNGMAFKKIQAEMDLIPGELQSSSQSTTIDLVELLQMTEEDFRERFRRRPLWRPKLSGMQRNAMIALANRGPDQNVEAAIHAIRAFVDSKDSVLADTARWALDQLRVTPK